MHRDSVVGPQGTNIDAELFLQSRLERQRKRSVHPTTERCVDADPPVPNLVAKPFDHDRAVIRHRAGGGGLVVQIGEQVLDRQIVKSGALAEALGGRYRFAGAELANHLSEGGAKLDWPAG